jgi:NADH-quinone oxidoreductase subunit F
MLKDQDRIFTNLYGMHDRTLAGAKKRGHWDGTAAIIARGATRSSTDEGLGLRGRGGAGSRRAEMVVHAQAVDGRPSYLVVNADESEPGTCKDREIMRHDPHTLIEGCLIASFAMGAQRLLHLHPRRIHPRARGAAGRHRRML